MPSARKCHLPTDRLKLTSSLSSAWGRADRHTSHDSNRVWGVLFCSRILGVPRPTMVAPWRYFFSYLSPFWRSGDVTPQRKGKDDALAFSAWLLPPAAASSELLSGKHRLSPC